MPSGASTSAWPASITAAKKSAAVIGQLLLAALLPTRGELALHGLAALVAGAWCSANVWRGRQAHRLVSGLGWLALSVFTLGEASLAGRSLVGGDEQLVPCGVNPP